MLHSCQRYGNIALWLSDAIWRQRSGSTLDKVMACCLMVPRHYLNKWLIISKVLCYYPHGFTQQMHKVPVIDISLKFTNSKSWPHFSGDNNLMHFLRLLHDKTQLQVHSETRSWLYLWQILDSDIWPTWHLARIPCGLSITKACILPHEILYQLYWGWCHKKCPCSTSLQYSKLAIKISQLISLQK